MTEFYYLDLIRCPECGYKYYTYVAENERTKIFSNEPCPKCKPQKKLGDFIEQEHNSFQNQELRR